jgi:fibronectin type 3 domain-containing protein
VPTLTETPVPTATSTPKPTATSTPKPTATSTPKPTATSTPKPTATSTPKPTSTPKASISTPVLKKVGNSAKGAAVYWNKVNNATSYTIYRKTGNSTTWKKIGTVTGNSTCSYIDTTVISGKKYTYTVSAYSSSLKKSSSYDKTGITTCYLSRTPLCTPINANTGVNVKWKAVSGASGYNVYRKLAGASSWTRIAKVSGANVTNYVDSTAESGKTYVYTVRAYNGSYLSSYVAAGVKITRLSSPKFTLSTSSGSVTVKWGKVTGATGYYVYRRLATTDSWVKIKTITSATTLSFKDTTAEKGKKYFYTVKAYDESGYSSHYANNSIVVAK